MAGNDTHDDGGDAPNIAVIGAAGYIGSRVVVELQDAHPEWTVTALDNFYRGDVRSIGDLTVEHVDIRDRARLEEALAGADVVCHLAAISGVDDCDDYPDLAHEVNVRATTDVAWFCRKTGAGMIFPYSMAVLGDPESFPITADHPRDPLNRYGRTKVLGQRAVETFAEGAFPAHQLMKSNLYGAHTVDGQRVSKGTVINFFVERALADGTLTVYEPGTQARNYIHVVDVARAYVHSVERLLDQLEAGGTGATSYEIASDEDPSVMEIAELVQGAAAEHGHEADIELVENPRSAETLVDEFTIDTSRAREELGWKPEHTVEPSIRELITEG